MKTNKEKLIDLIEEAKELGEEKYERFIRYTTNVLICFNQFGEEFHNEVKPYIQSQNCDKLEEITDKYIARLHQAVQGVK